MQELRPVVEADSKLWVIGAKLSLLNVDTSQVQAVRLVVLSLSGQRIASKAVPGHPARQYRLLSVPQRKTSRQATTLSPHNHRSKININKAVIGSISSSH